MRRNWPLDAMYYISYISGERKGPAARSAKKARLTPTTDPEGSACYEDSKCGLRGNNGGGMQAQRQQMKGSQRTKPKVAVMPIENTGDITYFMPKAFLQKPRKVIVELPQSGPDGCNSVRVQLDETDWEHRVIWMSGEVSSGLPEATGDGWKFNGCATPAQLDRLILVLQTVARQADALGLRTPRETPVLS